jgi:hypothetical protein
VITSALWRRVGVVVSSTALGIVALGGVAAACPSGGGSGQSSSAQSSSGHTSSAHSSSGHDHGQGSDAHSKDAHGAAGSHATGGTAGSSGDVTQPQPLSNADQNAGGANGQCPGGPYCSTRDGSASGNGNGNGKATGKPCAGCVGKADNKNPKGQNPNGTDHNNGYECDGNHGIGQTNPAHTGCKPQPPVTTCSAGMVLLTGTCTPPPTSCPTDEAMVDLVCVLGEGDAQQPAGGSTTGAPAGSVPPTVSPSVLAVSPSVLGERVMRSPARASALTALPFTGVPTGELLLLAAAALAAGGALALAGRRSA